MSETEKTTEAAVSQRGSESSDGEIYLSASQVDTWVLCPRKWGWSYIEKIKRSNQFATQGVEIHGVLEKWLTRGEKIEAGTEIGKMVLPGLKHLPTPGTPSLEVEQGFVYASPVAKYRGFKDFQYFDAKRHLPVIGDHKSTVDFKWAKSEEDLRKNTQAVIYAADAMSKFGTDQAELRWIYYRTRGAPAAHPVILTVSKGEVEEQMGRVDGHAAQILQAYENVKSAKELPIDASGCDAYGGCVYRENCNLSPMERMKALMTQESLAEKMMRIAAEKRAARENQAQSIPDVPSGSAVATPSAPAPTPSDEPKTEDNSLLKKIQERKTQGVNPPPPAEEPPPPPVAVAMPETPAVEATAAPEPAKRGPGRPRKVQDEKSEIEAASIVAATKTQQVYPMGDTAEAFAAIGNAIQVLKSAGFSVEVKIG